MRRRDALRRVRAVAAFAIAANAGRWITRAGVTGGVLIMALGPLLSLRRGLGWGFDREIGFIGFLVMALFSIRSGLEEHRELGLDVFLRYNLVRPLEHGLGLLMGLVGTWLALTGLAFLAALLLSGGDAGLAVWTTAPWGLRLLVLLGFVPLAEAVATLRVPLVLPVLAYFGLLIALTLVLPEDQAVSLFIPVERGAVDQLARLGVQGVVMFGLSSVLFLLVMTLGPALRYRLLETRPGPP